MGYSQRLAGDRRVGRRSLWRYALVGGWLLFTVSLTIWWIYFMTDQLARMAALEQGVAADLVRYQRMLLWEGIVLLIFLVGGGGALVYFMWRERRERKRLEQFFAAFSHELKTPLASLLLQVEVLAEEFSGKAKSSAISRLLHDASRLNLQVENALVLAEPDGALVKEHINLQDLVREIEHHEPHCVITGSFRGAVVRGDRRALQCIFSNLVRNAHQHGKASSITFVVARAPEGRVAIEVTDNGSGFLGDRRTLGTLFARYYNGSGSGVGLFLVRRLVRQLGGRLLFPDSPSGFRVVVELPGAIDEAVREEEQNSLRIVEGTVTS